MASEPRADPFSSGSTGRRASVRKVADGVRGSELVQRASVGGRAVVDAAHDPSVRQVVARTAAPTIAAAMDGAGLRNKHGKVKAWRVARAAVRPRRSIVAAGQMAAGSGADQLKAAVAQVAGARAAPTDEEIARSRPLAEPTDAMARARAAAGRLASAEPSQVSELRSIAADLADGLRWCILDDPIFDSDDEVVGAAGDALASSLQIPDEAWRSEDDACVRIALAVIRRYGVQPEELGGNGELDLLFEDEHSRMRMAMAMAPGRWSCDLQAWFADGRRS